MKVKRAWRYDGVVYLCKEGAFHKAYEKTHQVGISYWELDCDARYKFNDAHDVEVEELVVAVLKGMHDTVAVLVLGKVSDAVWAVT